jgi:hypothetical protein
MAPKRIDRRIHRGGDRRKKSASLRSKESRGKNRAFVKQLQSAKMKLLEENATLHAVYQAGQKPKEQLKDRVCMQGSCFLAIESVRGEVGA